MVARLAVALHPSHQPSAGRSVTNLTRPHRQPREHLGFNNDQKKIPRKIDNTAIQNQDALSIDIPSQGDEASCSTINCNNDGPAIGLTIKMPDRKWEIPKTKAQLLKERLDKLRKENRETGDGKTL